MNTYQPDYEFIDCFDVEFIGMTDDSDLVTLIGRPVKNDILGDKVHLLCEFDDLATLIVEAGASGEPILDFMAKILSNSPQHEEDTFDILDVCGKAIRLSGRRLRVYVPQLGTDEDDCENEPDDLLLLDRIMPRTQQPKVAAKASMDRIYDKMISMLVNMDHDFVEYENLREQGLSKRQARYLTRMGHKRLMRFARLSHRYFCLSNQKQGR